MIEIVCLANSTKNGYRCVAGLRTDGRGWIRPVSRDEQAEGALPLDSICLDTGGLPKPLDVLSIGVESPCPSAYQPENWYVTGERWRLMGRSSSLELLAPHIESGPALLGNLADAVQEEQFAEKRPAVSLALVRPDGDALVMSRTQSAYDDGVRYRARFELNHHPYNLSLTDLEWRAKLDERTFGEYTAYDLGLPPPASILMTISLGEPWNGRCYKYVAAVMAIG